MEAGSIVVDSKGAFAIIERESILVEVPLQAFRDCLECEPGFAQSWCNELCKQMLRMQRRMERMCLRQAPQRIIHYLVTESPGNSGEMDLPFPKYVWAAHMGMTPETLSRALGDLIKAARVKNMGGNRYRLLRRNENPSLAVPPAPIS